MNREQSSAGHASGSQMQTGQVFTEARARIIWGDPPESVRAYLTSNGVPGTAADAKIKEFLVERNRELRSIGFRNLVIGLALIGTAGTMIYFFARLPGGTRSARLLALTVLVGLIGLWKLVNGIVYLLSPQTDHESIPDIPD
jgi:hypothetical protein